MSESLEKPERQVTDAELVWLLPEIQSMYLNVTNPNHDQYLVAKRMFENSMQKLWRNTENPKSNNRVIQVLMPMKLWLDEHKEKFEEK